MLAPAFLPENKVFGVGRFPSYKDFRKNCRLNRTVSIKIPRIKVFSDDRRRRMFAFVVAVNAMSRNFWQEFRVPLPIIRVFSAEF